MLWVYSLMFCTDATLPIILKSCPLFWALGAVMFLLMLFSDKAPQFLKVMLVTALMGIGTVSVIRFVGSEYATIAYPTIIVQSILTIPLVLMTKTADKKTAIPSDGGL